MLISIRILCFVLTVESEFGMIMLYKTAFNQLSHRRFLWLRHIANEFSIPANEICQKSLPVRAILYMGYL